MGSLFIPTFKKKEITTRSYLTNVINYIHNNPVHHGMVKHLDYWPHSSYPILLDKKQSPLKIMPITQLYNSKEEFMQFHKPHLEKKAMEEMELILL